MPATATATANLEETSTRLDTSLSFTAAKARVRPRIISPVTGEAIPLDDKIGQLIEEGRYKLVGLVGGPGSGKTTALRHLAAILPPWALAQVRLVDNPRGYADIVALDDPDCHLVITSRHSAASYPSPGHLFPRLLEPGRYH